MSLNQTARWKTASDKEIASLEKHGVFKLVPISSLAAGHKFVGTRWVLEIKAKVTYKRRFAVQRFSQIPGMSITRDREKGAITIR